jgi:cell fate (sporulation/competence/biofilm development) regulator YlbF (YheA/YmcA/DUF963 family)
MTMLTDDSAVMAKARELCATIAGDEHFQTLQKQVGSFMADEPAKAIYQDVHQRGSELQQKQQAGVELAEAEIQQFESAREQLLDHPVAKGFLDAQAELETLQRAIGKFVGLTLELGRVPTADDFAAAEGGCGGGGGGGGCCND